MSHYANKAQIVHDFKKFKKRVESLRKMAASGPIVNKSNADDYYSKQNQLTEDLREFLRGGEWVQALSKAQLIELCAWESSYRPMAPHQFLNYFYEG